MAPSHEIFPDVQKWEQEKPGISKSTKSVAKWVLDILRPSILTKSGPRRQLKRTSYLDGIRGFAAFLVYWQHHELWPLRSIPGSRIMETGFGFEGKYYFAAFPGIRTLFTGGHFAVAIFFVISGYVLSAKPLSLIYAGHFEELGNNLGSALFRRWFRLHVPVILVSFVYMSMWHGPFGIWTLSPKHEKNFRDELWNWYIEFKNFSFVFRQGGEAWFTYNFPTWSIPVEFRGSIIVYTSLLALAKSTRDVRLWSQVGMIVYFLYIVDGWYGALFVAGMLLCELDILSRNNELPHFMTRLKPRKTPIFYGLFFVSFWLSGVPSHVRDITFIREVPGWYYLSFFVPQAVFDQKWFYLFWAAVCFIACAPRIWWLKAFFETSFNQYLGRISFALYLVHGPVLWVLGDRLYAAGGWYREIHEEMIPGWVNVVPLSEAGPLGLEPRFLVPHLILLPVTFWLSEIVMKLCDEPINNFSRWMYGKGLAPAIQPLELHR